MKASLMLLAWLPALACATDAPAVPTPHIVLVGDSTVTDQSGWGSGFRRFVTADAIVSNLAQNGRSSKSFIAEGHWAKALARKGDYYLIQFGHNDQPGKGPDRETDPATTYTANMARYVDGVLALGAQPVLVTSLVRRNFSPTDPARIDSTLTPYVEAVRKLAAEKNIPLIDLHALSLACCEKIGPAETAKLNPVKPDGSPDTTHLDFSRSAVFARLVAGAGHPVSRRQLLDLLSRPGLWDLCRDRHRQPFGRRQGRGIRERHAGRFR